MTLKLLFGRKFHVKEELRQKILAMDEYILIKNYPLLIQSLSVLGIVLLGFVFHGMLHYEPATIAILGAAVLLIISRENPHHVLRELEWSTLFFFMGLFIIVGGVVKVGLISKLSEGMISLTKPSSENMFVTAITTLWFSAISSAIIDNIPFVTSMIPLVLDTAHAVLPSGMDFKSIVQHSTLMPVWWSLALGACLGGNGTPVGASANVITIGLAAKAGYPISFKKFILYAIPITVETIVISTLYIWLRYYIL